MRRVGAALTVLVALALAGCSDGAEPDAVEPPAQAPSPTVVATDALNVDGTSDQGGSLPTPDPRSREERLRAWEIDDPTPTPTPLPTVEFPDDIALLALQHLQVNKGGGPRFT